MKKTQNKQWAVKAMTDSELESALHRELSAPKTNWDTAQLYLHELYLRSRNQQKSVGEDLAAYRQLHHTQRQLAAQDHVSPRWFLRAAALVTVMICFICFLPMAALGEFDVYSFYDKDHFRLCGQSESQDVPKEYRFQSDNPSLQKIHTQVLEEFGVQRVVPTWIPEDFSLVDAQQNDEHFHYLSYSFLRNGKYIGISYEVFFEEHPNVYCKDNMTPMIYEAGGVRHNIFSNAGTWVAVWMVNEIECTIYAQTTREELIQIIDSIYEGGLHS